jgi:ABC-type enterochelin transport system permease subunit
MPSIGSRLPRLFALVLGFSSSNGLLLKFVTPVSRVSPSYAANNDAKHSEYRGLITFDLDNTVFPMQV